MCGEGHSDAPVGGDLVDGGSFCVIAGDFFSHPSEVFDLALLERLLNFSPFPAMTNSG